MHQQSIPVHEGRNEHRKGSFQRGVGAKLLRASHPRQLLQADVCAANSTRRAMPTNPTISSRLASREKTQKFLMTLKKSEDINLLVWSTTIVAGVTSWGQKVLNHH